MKFMLLTADVDFAKEAQNAGVDRIFLDLEYINKVERQKGRNTVISHNTVENVAPLRRVLDKSELLVRINPINPNSKKEIDSVIANGADIIMLPMVIDAEDVKILVDYVRGRAKVCPMLETAQSLIRIDDILSVDGIDELFIGLNDLHISMQLVFMFELLSGGIVEYMTSKIKAKGLPFGFGGLAKIGEGLLPAEYVLGEHHRLGSSSVILSRTFRNEVGNLKNKVDLGLEVLKLRNKEMEISMWTTDQYEENRLYIKSCVNNIVSSNL